MYKINHALGKLIKFFIFHGINYFVYCFAHINFLASAVSLRAVKLDIILGDLLKKTLSIEIKRLDMFPNHFFGSAKINNEDYKINIQGQSIPKEQLIKLPIPFMDEKALLRLSGARHNVFFEDIVTYKGESEWIEIDSDRILYFLADHQDQIDTIDVLSRF